MRVEPVPLATDMCPECGGAAVMVTYTDSVIICCDECEFYIEEERRDQALEKWNNHERYEL